MIIKQEIALEEFDGWCGARETIDTVYNAGMIDELEAFFESEYPEGITETELNDILRFESDWVFEMLGIEEEEDEDED